MSCCGSSNTLIIGRPTQNDFDNATCAGTVKAVPNNGCANGSCGTYTSPHDRKIGPRKNREKVREDIKDYVLLMLGAPVVKVELDSQGLDLCVDQALKIYEEYAGSEFFDYYTFITTPGKSVYKMPDDVGVIKNVHYKKQASFGFQASDLGGAIPVEYSYPGSAAGGMSGSAMNPVSPVWGRAGEWVLYKQYEQMFSRLSSQIGGWEWVSDTQHIKLYPIPCYSCRVIVNYLQKCKDWREVNQAMQEGALAHAMIMLGHIRGKYLTIPGIQGGTQIDGEYMKTKGWELKKEWQEELLTRYGSLLPISMD